MSAMPFGMSVPFGVSSEMVALGSPNSWFSASEARLAADSGQAKTETAETRPGSMAIKTFALGTGSSPIETPVGMAVPSGVSSDMVVLASSIPSSGELEARLAAGSGQGGIGIAEPRLGLVAVPSFVSKARVSGNIHPTRS